MAVSSNQIPAGLSFQANTKNDLFFYCGAEEYNLNTNLLDDIVVDDEVNVIDFDIHTDKSNISIPDSSDLSHKKYESFIRFFSSVKNFKSHSTFFYFFIFFLIICISVLIFVLWKKKMDILCSVIKCCYNSA